MIKRHSWSEKNRPDEHHTLQVCWDCGLEKIGRHESGHHWTEWRKGGKRIPGKATPPCEVVREAA